jgi:glycosyltransferase involved in cell wall biosynthesis
MTGEPRVSVVLPVYNQEDHIGEIIRDYIAVLNGLKDPVEIILVVNASRDRSLERCRVLERSDSRIRVLHEEKGGWGRAVRAGLAAADGQILCYTNSARTNSYTLALHIMLAAANPTLVIKANRRLRYSIARRVGSVLYNFECRSLFDLPVWDVNGTPKLFPRNLLNRLHLREDGDLIDLEFIVRCKQLRAQILEVPIVSSRRHGGESTTNFISALKMYAGAFRLRRSLVLETMPDRGPEDSTS